LYRSNLGKSVFLPMRTNPAAQVRLIDFLCGMTVAKCCPLRVRVAGNDHGGCPCFIHGTSVAEFENSIQGDLVRMKFKMDDESELLIDSYYMSSKASLSFRAHVTNGKCAGLGFMGTLSRQ
jgi:hypothetical protein